VLVTDWVYSEEFDDVKQGDANTRERFAGREMRVSWWRPGWGDRHPAIMIANGLAFAAQEDAMCGGGVGTAGSLDLIDQGGVAQPWISAYRSAIASARGAATSP